MSEENKEFAKELKFKFVSHMNLKTCGVLQRRCEYKSLVLWWIVTTRKNSKEGWGKGKTTFAIGSEKKEYKDIDEFLNVVRERTSMKVA